MNNRSSGGERPPRMDQFEAKAAALVSSRERVQRLVNEAAEKMTHAGGDRLRAVQGQLSIAVALVRAWVAGEYKDVSTSSIISVVAALIYFVVPLDVIPDFLFGWGYIDDIAVITYVFGQVTEEIEKFKRWRDIQTPGSPPAATSEDD